METPVSYEMRKRRQKPTATYLGNKYGVVYCCWCLLTVGLPVVHVLT